MKIIAFDVHTKVRGIFEYPIEEGRHFSLEEMDGSIAIFKKDQGRLFLVPPSNIAWIEVEKPASLPDAPPPVKESLVEKKKRELAKKKK